MSSNSCPDWLNPFKSGGIDFTDFSVSGSEDIAAGNTGTTLIDIDAFQRVADSVTVLTASSDFDQIQIVGQNGITVSLSEASSTTAKYTITGQNFLNAGTPSSLVYYNTGTTISATEGVTYDSINSIFNTITSSISDRANFQMDTADTSKGIYFNQTYSSPTHTSPRLYAINGDLIVKGSSAKLTIGSGNYATLENAELELRKGLYISEPSQWRTVVGTDNVTSYVGLQIKSGSYPSSKLLIVDDTTLVVTGSKVGVGTDSPSTSLDVRGLDNSTVMSVHSVTKSNLLTVTGSGVGVRCLPGDIYNALTVSSVGTGPNTLFKCDTVSAALGIRLGGNKSILNTMNGGSFGSGADLEVLTNYGHHSTFYDGGYLNVSSSGGRLAVTGSDDSVLLGIHSSTTSNIFHVTGSGRVSINPSQVTTNPTAALNVRALSNSNVLQLERSDISGVSAFFRITADTILNLNSADFVIAHNYGDSARFYQNGRLKLSSSSGNSSLELTGSDSSTLLGIHSATKSNILTVTGNGSVGINNSSPDDYWSSTNQLVVSGPNHSGITIASNSVNTSGIAFADGTSGTSAYAGVIQYVHSLDAFRFYTNNQLNAPQLYLDSAGNLGINTSIPNKKLSIVASGATEDVVQVQSANGSVCIRDEIYSNNGATRWFNGNSAQHIIGADSTFGGVVFNELGRSDTNFRIETANQSNMFYVNAANDRIGIGTNNPQGMLHLEADATGNDPSYPHILLSDTTPADSREVKIECIAGDYVVEQGTSLTSGTPSIGGKYTLGDGGLHILNGTSLSFRTQAAGHEYFKVTTSGTPGVSIGYATTNTHAVKGSLQSISDASKFTFNTAAGTFKVIDSSANSMLNITSASSALSKRILLSSTNGAELDIVNYSVNQTAGIHTVKLSTADFAAPHWVIRNNSNADILNINTTLINAGVDAQFAQDVTIYGTLTEASSRKFKEKEEPLGNQLDNIMKLNPVTFTWKSTNVSDIGFIAEDFNSVYPDLTTMEGEQGVHYDENEKPVSTYGGIKYSKITSVLTKGMQELYNMVKEQNNEISELKKEILLLKKGK